MEKTIAIINMVTLAVISTILTPRNINILLTPSGKKLSVIYSGFNAAESWVDYRSSSDKRYAVPSINRLAS